MGWRLFGKAARDYAQYLLHLDAGRIAHLNYGPLSMKVGTVMSRLPRGRKRLQQWLSSHGMKRAPQASK